MAIHVFDSTPELAAVLKNISGSLQDEIFFYENIEYHNTSEKELPELVFVNIDQFPQSLTCLFNTESIYRNIPVVFTGEQCSGEIKRAVYSSGGKDYLYPPFIEEELIEKISCITSHNRDLVNLKILSEIDSLIRSETDIENALGAILDHMLYIFDCDRVWLMPPRGSDETAWVVPMERTKKEFPCISAEDSESGMLHLLQSVQDSGDLFYGNIKDNPEFDPDGKLSVKSYMVKALHPESEKSWVFGVHKCSNKRIWLENEKKLFHEIAVKVEYVLSRMILYRNLKLSEKKYRDIYESIHDVYVETSLDGTFLELSPSVERVMGYKREELIGLSVLDYYHDISQRDQLIEGTRRNGEILDYNVDLIRKDGSVHPFSISSTVDRDSRNNPVKIKSILRDISERRRAEKAVWDTNFILESVIEQSPVPIVLTDAVKRNVRIYNSAAGEILQIDPESSDVDELKMTPCLYKHFYSDGKLMPHDEHPAFKAMEGHSTHNQELIVERADGTRRWIMMNAIPIYNRDHELVSVLSIFPDITELKLLQIELQKSTARFDMAMEASRDGLFDWNLRTDEIYFSPGWKSMLGYEPHELPDDISIWESLVDDSQRNPAADVIRKIREGELDHFEKEIQMKHRDGHFVEIFLRGRVFFDAAGVAERVVGTHVDITALKNTEKRLLENEERLRSIFDNSPVGLALFDSEYRYIMLNENAASLNKIPADRRMGRKVADVISEKASRYVIDNLKKVFETGEPHKIDFSWVINKNTGERKYLSIYHFPVKDDEGDVESVGVIIIDVTEVKNAENMVRESESRLQAIFSNVPVGLVLFDRDYRYLMVNRAVSKIDGFPVERHIGARFSDLFPDISELAEEYINDVFKTGKAMRNLDISLNFAEVSDSVTHLIVSYFPVMGVNNEVASVGSAIIDITEHVKTRELLIKREAKLQAFSKSAPIGIALIVGRMIQEVNDRLCVMTGYSRNELIGRDTSILYATREAFEQVGDEKKRQIMENGTGTVETVFINKEGNSMDVLISFSALDPENILEGIALTVLDISKLKKSEAERVNLQSQLLQSQKMESVGRLAGGVAHDFNNMLNVILGHAEMALMKLTEKDSLYKRFKEIQKAAVRSSDLTRQLLAFSRNQSVAPEIMDVNRTVENMLSILKRLIGEDIELILEKSELLKTVRIDPAQLDQVLVNLVVNARDSITGTGRITIETENTSISKDYCERNIEFCEGEFVIISVTDTGHGMDRETREKIFEPFFTTKKIGEGTGLGLATVYGIIRQNNGFINVYSEPGYGSVFRIYLPSCDEKPEEGTLQENNYSEVKGGTETILFVEDENSILELGIEMLTELGYSVLSASTPGNALSLTGDYSGSIDLLITDVIMPEMNGRDLSIKLSSLYPDIKTLFISGYTANIITRQGVIDMGAKFLQKPFTKHNLARRIREVLDSE